MGGGVILPRLWHLGEEIGGFANVDEAIDAMIGLLPRDKVLVVIPDKHSLTGEPLLQFVAPELLRGLICVVYGATMDDWDRHAHKLDEALQ